jgi:cobalt-precorrin-5B (C1)-methyltransferase
MPDGSSLEISVKTGEGGAAVVKDAGDDPDVTHGALICAYVELSDFDGEIVIKGGRGVGVVTKAGLQIPVGEAAINPVPRKMIEENVRFVTGSRGAVVTVSVPEGERLAEQTFNSRIGVLGGISIIGTTGIVKPMSVDALVDSFKCEIDVKLAAGESIFIVPGKIGEKHLQRICPEVSAVMVSNYFGEAFAYLREKEVAAVTLAGHPGKLAKLAMGHYSTHSSASPQAQEFVAEKLGLTKNYNTVEEICAEHPEGFGLISEFISAKVRADYKFSSVRVFLFDMQGKLIGKHNS